MTRDAGGFPGLGLSCREVAVPDRGAAGPDPHPAVEQAISAG
ncbi:hypothetical protein ACFQV2_25370 [Actinokineospora soli]|uniref:Uncharacterized protein n=1 Tax=Actinokineospora soli TaxID=1048753 RepID=A0ABW2TS58_9PSEU